MAITEIINKNVQKLPENSQAEVLDFVEFLLEKSDQKASVCENSEWTYISLSFAMRGMEEEEPL